MESHPTDVNQAAVDHARSLIADGVVSTTTPWTPPTAELGDELIARDGIESYGQWFLGVHPGTDPQTKGYYGFPISNDFTTIDVAGLRASEERAAEWGHTAIEQAAKELRSEAER